MRWLRAWFFRLGELFHRQQRNRELAAEIESHVQMHIEDNLRAGMDPVEARRQARIKFGGMESTVEAYRRQRGVLFGGTMLQDLRYAVRIFKKSPGFTAVAIITLALGIGANTAIFSLINAIMLRTLPVKNPKELVSIKWTARSQPNIGEAGEFNWGGCPDAMPSLHPAPEGCVFSYPMFQQIKSEQRVFSDVIAMVPSSVPVNVLGHTTRSDGLCVSGDFFSALGARPALGRLLNRSDDDSSASPALVVSYRFWRGALDGDSTVVGKPILLGKTRYTLVGIASPEFGELDPGIPLDFWVPLVFQPDTTMETAPRALWVGLMARLRPGISVTQAKAAMTVLFAESATNGPMAIFKPEDMPKIELPTAAYGLNSLRYNFTHPLFTLFAAVGLVLLIACANIAGLTLSRSTARRKEIAMRAALGAARMRIVRQLLTESILLSVAGGAAGILLGYWGAHLLVLFLSTNFEPLAISVHPDAHILAFTLLVSVAVGLVFGVVPALNSAKLDLIRSLKEGPGSTTEAPQRRWFTLGNGLVAVQMALTVVVLMGAGLLARTLANLKSVDLGFDPRNLLIFDLNDTYANRMGKQPNSLGELRERLRQLPGVSSVSYSFFAPMKGGRMQAPLNSIGNAKLSGVVSCLTVAPDFFKTMRIPLIAGRTINARDMQDQKQVPEVAVVNEDFARLFLGKENPVGQHFQRGSGKNETEIVGVVGNARHENVRDESLPMVYFPTAFSTRFGAVGTFEIRTAFDPKAMMPEIRSAVLRFDPNLLITDMKTQEEQIDQNIYQERLIANLSSLFALLALVVACVGIYGLLSYQVTRRTREIGVRLALGAQRGDVLRLVIRQGAILTVLGALIGAAAALAATRYLQSFLYGVKPSDPVTLIAAAILLISLALLASYIPARRAMKIDPMVALRYE